MDGPNDVYTFFQGSVTAFGGFGIAVAIALLLLLRLVVPRPQKHVVRAPLLMLLFSIAFAIVNGVLSEPGEHTRLRLVHEALLLFAVARSFYLLILYGIFESRRRRARSRLFSGIFRDIVQVAIYAVATVFLLKEAGVETGSLLTSSVLLTAVIGLSLQDTLGNLFAGIAIQVQQPFEVGDWIQFDDDTDHIGEVVEINWRATRIITIDRIEVTVPNNTLARAAIRNYSRPTQLARRNATIIAPYNSPPARVHRLLAEAVVEVEGVVDHPAPDIQTIEFNERGVEYRVRYFIERFDEREVIDSRVRDRLWYALRRAALPIPPPQRTVTVVEHTAASAQAEHAAQVVDIERALAKVPMFKPLPHDLLHEVAMHTERRLYAPGEIVIQQGDVGEELFMVERGALDVLIDAHDGMQHIATVAIGDVFGEMSLMTGEDRAATVRTTMESALLVVSKETIQPVLEASPELAEKISEVLAAREAALEGARGSKAPSRKKVEERSSELLNRIREFFSI
ncbi:MAG: mechanosensitive ion channel family protein [Myxococcales bacterium]|nr:mechanosensitive ion channel family protein [Myxococcales bacterium]